MGEDSTLTVWDAPRVVVDYAAENDATWQHLVVEDILDSRRRRVGVREVETPAGRFACVEIETTYTEDFGLAWTDCVGAPGLVSRELRYDAVPATDAFPMGIPETIQRWTLTAYTPGGSAKRGG